MSEPERAQPSEHWRAGTFQLVLPLSDLFRLGCAEMAKRIPRATNPIPNRLTLGIDEAGRGPAIGPMVMAAVAVDSRTAAILTRKGLRDSKAYGAGDDAHAIRKELAAEIRVRAKFVLTIEVEHDEIDQRVCRGELNVLERELATKLIDQAPRCDKIIADGKRMFSALCLRYSQFISVDHAEDHH